MAMHPPTLRQLQFLTSLAEEGSFSRAAQACNVTQPTLSAAIRETEAILGVQLVERRARGAALTPAGQAAVQHARRILSDVGDLITAARDAAAPLSGVFRLGAIPTIAPYVLPSTISELKRDYPALKLYLREDLTVRLLDRLRASTLDAAIIALPWETQGIETESLFEDEFLLAFPDGHALGEAEAISPAHLDGEDVLLLEEGHCLRGHALTACDLPHTPRERQLAATSLHTLIHMVGGGLGLSLIPKLAADAGLGSEAGVAMRRFDTPLMGRAIGIAWRAGSPRGTEARLIGRAIKRAHGR